MGDDTRNPAAPDCTTADNGGGNGANGRYKVPFLGGRDGSSADKQAENPAQPVENEGIPF